ncbi:ankyrin repeat domain-containing protein [Legionella quateirensis]|uniref:Uncharacterized protein n=1 Tax=Legionella quateirensis TaxID=45072 RepID=A0A378KQV7_9GAMM|nr:ankyrin repeat domain-containing protein [Legionella quateirensis]KTD54783.1 hypothetical protein Lqua_0290 [Legionella quateirensis]STY16963.1 Uncharacterised protein [Legionella quateirensis]
MIPSSQILALLRKNHSQILLHPTVTVNNFGSNLLHQAANYPEVLQHHLNNLTPTEQYSLITKKNQIGNTLLHTAAMNVSSLKIALSLYPANQQLDALEEKNEHGNNVVHLATSYPDSLDAIVNLYPKERCLTVLQEVNNDGDTALHLATSNPASLRMLLPLYPQEGLLGALMQKNKNEDNVLDRACNSSPEALKILLDSLSDEDKLSIINETNRYGYTKLQWSIHNQHNLKVFLHALPESSRLSLVLEEDQKGRSLLDRAMNHPSLLLIILQGFPEIAPHLPHDTETLFTINNVPFLKHLLQCVDHIRQLKNYATHLVNYSDNELDRTEGIKAINLAEHLNRSINNFIKAKINSDRDMEHQAQIAFKISIQKGYNDMNVHRKIWKPLLSNLIIAATGIGILLIIGNFIVTGHVFFSQTQRQKRIDEIKNNFNVIENCTIPRAVA